MQLETAGFNRFWKKVFRKTVFVTLGTTQITIEKNDIKGLYLLMILKH